MNGATGTNAVKGGDIMNGATGMTAADVLALTNGRDGGNFLEGNGILIILFFLIMGRGNLFGGNDSTSRAFENQNVINKLDTMSTGLGNATWSLNDSIHRALDDLQKCCCETNRNIDAVRYENERNACNIINAGNANTQAILKAFNDYAMEQKNVKIMEQGQLLSEQRIVSQMKPVAPVPAYVVANPYCGCGSVNGSCGNLY